MNNYNRIVNNLVQLLDTVDVTGIDQSTKLVEGVTLLRAIIAEEYSIVRNTPPVIIKED